MKEINFKKNKDYSYSDNDFKANNISVKEFKDNGYLQEINRLFLHKLGLALEIGTNGDDFKILGIIDCRKEGIMFDLENSDIDRKNRFDTNIQKVKDDMDIQKELRGFDTEEL